MRASITTLLETGEMTEYQRTLIANALSSEVWELAVRYTESLEHSGQIDGNGHHLAQQMGKEVKKMLLERWKESVARKMERK